MKAKKQSKKESAESFQHVAHGEFFEKNVRYHNKDGSTCLVTYSNCKDKPIDRKTYTERPKEV